jgi:tetratricopeptide (TPR) repeat protein
MLRLDTLADSLKEKVEDPGAVLDVLVTALAKGQHHTELWDELHRAVVRDELGAEMAFAYEHVAQDKRTKLITPSLQAELFMHAARFSSDIFGDPDGAIGYAERALSAVPGHAGGFALLERLLGRRNDYIRLAKLYIDAASSERDKVLQLELLRRAAVGLTGVAGADELGIDVYQRILRIEPADAEALAALEGRFLGSGRHRDAAKLLEQALLRYSDPGAREALAIRGKLLGLYTEELGEPQRAIPHVEALLGADPSHEQARRVAEALLEHRTVAPRAAAALSDAYDRLGLVQNAADMLTRELKLARGPRRNEVQRRLAVLRQDVLGDPAGALELLGPAVAADPGDDELRRRFVELSCTLNQPLEAARLLARACQTVRDVGVAARVGVEIGQAYHVSGDVKSALVSFQKVVDVGGDDGAMLVAARRLADLHAEAGDLKKLAFALELVVKLEPDAEARQAAARRLAKLADSELEDKDRAIAAYQVLVDSMWADEALGRLTALYEESGNLTALVGVLERRAERSRNPDDAKRLTLRAAELRSARPSQRPAAIGAWRGLVDRYGPSREVHARLVPLLEQERQWDAVCSVLLREIELVGADERPDVWARIGQLKLSRLDDPRGALDAFRRALEQDPRQRTARAAMEKMLTSGDLRLEAADVLEPTYRAENSPAGLVRVLEARADLAPEVTARLGAFDEALWLLESELGDREHALVIAGRALKLAVRMAPNALAEWLGRLQALAAVGSDPAARAQVFVDALGDQEVTSPDLLELARSTAEALVVTGDITRAVEVYRRALSYDPSSAALLGRIDELLTEQNNPQERLQLYRSALAQPCEPARRRELIHAMARVQRKELGDLPGAVASYCLAVENDPRDQTAHQALVELYAEQADWSRMIEELERALVVSTGERRVLMLRKLAETEAVYGDGARALEHYRQLMQEAELSDELLGRIEELAQQHPDPTLVREVLERRIHHATDAEARVTFYERLGRVLAVEHGDPAAAADAWAEAAHIAEQGDLPQGRAVALYEKVLEVAPRNREAAERLFGLYARSSAWAKLPRVFSVLLDEAEDPREPVTRLLAIEGEARRTGGIDVYVSLLDAALERRTSDRARTRHLQLAKARALTEDHDREDEVAAVYREVLAAAEADGPAVAEAFEQFLTATAVTPPRIDDRRWLLGWRVDHSSNPVGVLLAWAQAEEQAWGNPRGAAALYQRVVALDPQRTDALIELGRLLVEGGDPEGAVTTLRSLSALSEGEQRARVDLKIASLLVDPLSRSEEALGMAESLIETYPTDPEVLRIVNHALGIPKLRARAADLLERASESGGDSRVRAEVLEALLALPDETPALKGARRRWFEQLLECRADDSEATFAVALRGTKEHPESMELWTAAERLARRLSRPDPVVDAYSAALEHDLDAETAETLGRRMVEFYEEWFEEPDRVIGLLQRVLVLCPDADWAFDRLKLAFNGAGRWPELFALYDQRLGLVGEAESGELLREAAMAAKDFAADADRAISYLERLARLCPTDLAVESSLERLYEREGRKRALIELLGRRLTKLGPDEARQLCIRIAGLWLDIDEPVPAFELLGEMRRAGQDTREVYQLLERLVALPAAGEAFAPAPPVKGKAKPAAPVSVRDASALALREHYEQVKSLPDVARMMEVLLESAAGREEQVTRLREIVALRLERIADHAGAFRNVAQLVTLEPDREENRQLLAELAERIGAHDRRAELLSSVGRQSEPMRLRAMLLREAADVYDRSLGDASSAIGLHFEVLELAHDDRELVLDAARDLDRLLEATGRADEHCRVLEQRAALERDVEARRVALAKAARVAEDALGDLGRAIAAWRTRLADDAADLEALNGLAAVLGRAGRHTELVATLRARADLQTDRAAMQDDLVRIARIQAEELDDRAAAIEAWYLVRRRCEPDLVNFEALVPLLEAEDRWHELGDLLNHEAEREGDAERKRALQLRLGELHRRHTGDLGLGLRAFVAAGEWKRAVEAAGAEGVPKELGLRACQDLLDLAVAGWTGEGEASEEAAKAAAWAIGELSERLRGAGNHEAVVALLLRGAALPFPRERKRELRREAACVCSDQLGDTERAVQIFRDLFAEDPHDSVSASSVTRLALLLEERGLHAEIAELWEQQAESRAASGSRAAAAALFTRAADIWINRLGDAERALADYRQGAGLGGEQALEELARIHEQRGEHRLAAEALEWLCAQSSREALAERVLRLAEAYVATRQRGYARARLEWAAGTALDAAAVRRRLGELYREDGDWGPLAELLTAEAARVPDAKARLALLREAAQLHLEKRRQPGAAVPLLEQAADLEPDDPSLRLDLSRALERAGRFDEASSILRKQIEHYGTRRPKDRALVHFQLARVSLSAGRRAEAMSELGVANKIDPAHPGILQALARLAFEEKQYDRAERTYRALLLVLKPNEPDMPSRAEALLDLADIAMAREDAVRAAEFVESAFESAQENADEAACLERILRIRGRRDVLARAVRGRLERATRPEQAARALGDLAKLELEAGPQVLDSDTLGQRARTIQQGLAEQTMDDDQAWSALGTVYDILGDTEASLVVLERRVAAWASSGSADADPEAFYRLAEFRLRDAETRDRGMDLLERALAIRPEVERAEALLRLAAESDPQNERLVRLLEWLARAPGRERALAEALARIIRLPDADPFAVREAVELAKRLDDRPLLRSMLNTANEIGLPDEDAAWVRRELAEQSELDGDLGTALTLREQAAEFLSAGEARPFLLEVAKRAASEIGDSERAIRIYTTLLEREPADRQVWEPLLDLYRRLGAKARLVTLIDQTVPLVESQADRSRLRLEQASILLEQSGQADAAAEILQEILIEDPSQHQAAIMLSGILEKSGRHDELVALLAGQLDAAKDRQDAESIVSISLRMSALLEQQGRLGEAFDVCQAAVDWNPKHRGALEATVRLAEKKGDTFALADSLEGLLQVTVGEDAVPIAARLVSLRVEQRDAEAAERALELGFTACPSNAMLRDGLVSRYRKRGDYASMASALERATQVGPKDPSLVRQLVEAYRYAANPERALSVLEELVASEPDNDDLYRERAALYGELGREDEALADLERAHSKAGKYRDELIEALDRAIARAEPPRERELTLRLLQVLEAAGDTEAVRHRLSELVKSDPSDPEALRRLATMEERTENWASASTAYRRLIALEEGEALVEVALKLANACERAERFGDARGGLERAMKVAPDHSGLRECLRRLYHATGENRELARMLEEDAAKEPEVSHCLGYLLAAGDLWLAPDGDPEEAIRVLEQARKLSSENLEGLVLLARAYAASGRRDEAVRLLDETASANRGKRGRQLSAVHQEMSRLELEAGQAHAALESLGKAFDMDSRNGTLAMQLGALAVEVEEYESASRAFRAVTMMKSLNLETQEGATGEQQADANYYLAWLSYKQGDLRKAKILATKAVAKNPLHEQALAMLAQLEATR